MHTKKWYVPYLPDRFSILYTGQVEMSNALQTLSKSELTIATILISLAKQIKKLLIYQISAQNTRYCPDCSLISSFQPSNSLANSYTGFILRMCGWKHHSHLITSSKNFGTWGVKNASAPRLPIMVSCSCVILVNKSTRLNQGLTIITLFVSYHFFCCCSLHYHFFSSAVPYIKLAYLIGVNLMLTSLMTPEQSQPQCLAI